MGNIQRRPNGQWRARYRDPAGRERARHFRRRLDAERWLASVENAKHRGEWIDPALSRITVGEWAERWLKAQVQLKPLTLAAQAPRQGADPPGMGKGAPRRGNSR